MAENISPVDHFPDVLKHFADERLLKLTTYYEEVANYGSADRFVYDRAAKCQHECERRGLRIPQLRRGKAKLVA